MVPISWATKLKKWDTEQKERRAKALMSPPEKTTLLKAIPYPGVVVIMGARGTGKSALAHRIMEQIHNQKKVQGAILIPSAKGKRKNPLPPWVKWVANISELPEKAVVLIDEAAQFAHARRTQSAQAVDLDNLVSISRHRHQLIIFVSHHSRKLDLNLIHDSDRLLWKEPTEAHAMFERDELQMFTLKALDFFATFPKKQRLKITYVMNLHQLQFNYFLNGLPKWWSETISDGFRTYR